MGKIKRIREEVVNLRDLRNGDDVTFHFEGEDGINATQDGVVDITNVVKGICSLRTGPEAIRIMNDWFLIVRRPKPLPPKPKKRRILEKVFSNIDQLNDWWSEHDVVIISISNNVFLTCSPNTVVYYHENEK